MLTGNHIVCNSELHDTCTSIVIFSFVYIWNPTFPCCIEYLVCLVGYLVA